MAVKRLAPLGPLRPWRIDGMVDSSVDPGAGVFALSAETWPGFALNSADRQAAPLCWTVQTAFTTWGAFFPDMNSFAADPDLVFVDPQPRWGTKGSLEQRLPRAVIVTQRPPGFVASPGRLACLALAAQLSSRKVFCGTRRFSGATGTHTIVRCCLPEKELTLISETFDDYLLLDVDEAQTQGGEVLFVVEDYTATDVTVSPYYDQDHAVALPLVKAHDLDLLARAAPKFAKVRWLYLQPFAELVTQDAKDAIQDFIDDDATGSVRYSSVNGALDSGPGLAQAQSAAQAEITDFFGL